jgi:hypothetical protein
MQRHDVVALNRATIRDYDTRTEARGVIRDAKRKGVRNIASRILLRGCTHKRREEIKSWKCPNSQTAALRAI